MFKNLFCSLILVASLVKMQAQSFNLSFEQESVDCSIGEVCYNIELSSDDGFDLSSFNFRFFYDCTQVEYQAGSANVSNLPASYMIINEIDLCVDASGLGTLPYDQTLSFLQIAVDHTISDPVDINSTPSIILQGLCFDILNPAILENPQSCFDLIWVTDDTRENYVNSVTTISSLDGGLIASDGTYISLDNTNNCFVEDCIDIDDPCVPIVDADQDDVCDVGDMPDPDPTDPCVPNFLDADEDGVCDVGTNADPDPNNPCIPNIVDADGDGICDIGPDPDPDPDDPCNPDFGAPSCIDPAVTFELSFSEPYDIDCEEGRVCYNILLRSNSQNFPLGSFNLRIFYDRDLVDAIDASPILSADPSVSNNYFLNPVNDMAGGNQSSNGSLPFDDNLGLLDLAIDFTGASPIELDTNAFTIIRQLCFTSIGDDLFNNPSSCMQLVWATNNTIENYTVGITTLNVASSIGVSADLQSSDYIDIDGTDDCFEFACIEDECSVIACNDEIQISLDSCVVVVDPEWFLEAPEFAPYHVEFFTQSGDFVRSDTLLGSDDGNVYQYKVRCLENFCTGIVRIETSITPTFNAPCSCTTATDTIPDACLISCALGRLPKAVLSQEEVESILMNCGPEKFGDLLVTSTIIDTLCHSNIEVHEVSYSAIIDRHGEKERVDLLCQRYGMKNIPLEGQEFERKVRFPSDLILECDAAQIDQDHPDSILLQFPDSEFAFPYFVGPHRTRIEEQIEIIDRIQIQTGITVQTERLVQIDANGDGELEWVLIQEATPIFRDSLVFDTTLVVVYDGYELVPLKEKLCNAVVSFTETEYTKCGNSKVILRTWSIIDWCGMNLPQYHTQTIEIEDTQSPTLFVEVDGQTIPFNTINDVQSYIEPWECFGRFKLPKIPAMDNCGTVDSIIWDSKAGLVQDSFITMIPKNNVPTEVSAMLLDECENATTVFFNVSVLDTIKPVPVCRNKVVLTLSPDVDFQNGLARINAEDLDGGSTDGGCENLKFSILRFPVASFTSIPAGSPSLTFTCADLGRDFTITLVVEDEAGNRNTCEVNIEIQNKLELDIQCSDVIIDCLDERPRRPEIIGDVCNEFRRALLFNDLQTPSAVCPQDGIIREWFLDVNGDTKISEGEPVCLQFISVYDSLKFDPYSIQWPKHYNGEQQFGTSIECADNDGIDHFEDQSIQLGDPLNCIDSSQDFGAPNWCETDCSLIALSVETDSILSDGFCMKIIKRWTLIDWCTYEANEEVQNQDQFELIEDWTVGEDCQNCPESNQENVQGSVYFSYKSVDQDGYYTFNQLIKYVDTIAPLIFTNDIIVPINSIAESKNDETVSCTAQGIISASAREDCGDREINSEFIKWTLKYNDGESEFFEHFQGVNFETQTLAGEPGEVHTALLTATDGCGNSSSSEISISFIDEKAPTPFCVNSITSVIMPTDGTVVVWAKDFDFGSFDNCTPTEDLMFSLVRNGVSPILPGEDGFDTQDRIVYTCTDIENSHIDNLNVWVWDLSGNGDFCTVQILIDDNTNSCENTGQGSKANIAGSLTNEQGMFIENGTVSLFVDAEESAIKTETSDFGEYAFMNNLVGSKYKVKAKKNTDYLNGVSTLDLLLIQKHLLGITPIESPYKIIAADVNNDEKISTADLVSLRKLILGIYTELPNNQSWRFVDASQTFVDPQNPFPLIEELSVDHLVHNMMNEDFIGIKIGDINGNAKANNAMAVEIRTNGAIEFIAKNADFVSGEIVRLPMIATQFDDIYGLQFTMDHEGLELIDIEAGVLNIYDHNIGVRDGQFTLSWNDHVPVSSDMTLFTLIFKAKESSDIQRVIELNSTITPAEAYAGLLLEKKSISIDFTNKNLTTDQLKLYQNEPNPFDSNTNVSFSVPAKNIVTFSVYDVSGKVVMQKSNEYNKGYHTISVQKPDLGASGLYYYEIRTGQQVEIKKMIVVD